MYQWWPFVADARIRAGRQLAACSRRWPATTLRPVRGLSARAEEALEDRRLGLLDLQEQGIVVRTAVEERRERSEPDAADADHLHGKVDQLVAVEQDPSVLLERLAVAGQDGFDEGVRHVVAMDDDRRVVHDPAVPIDDRGQLREFVHGVVMGGRLHGRLDHRPSPLVDEGHDARDGDRRVVDVDRPHRRVLGHPLSIGPDGAMDRMPTVMGREVARPSGHDQAGRQPEQVPLERTVERLVEVVDVEQFRPLRRREQPEVRQVGIATQLDADVGRRSRGQIGGHRQGRTAIEGERGDAHPAMSDRDELQRRGTSPARRGAPRDPADPAAGRQSATAVSGWRSRVAWPTARNASRVGRGVMDRGPSWCASVVRPM